jgi:preprotein translocase subunit SecF
MKDGLGLDVSSISLNKASNVYAVTFQEITDVERQAKLTQLQTKFGTDVAEHDFWVVSPSVSAGLKSDAFKAIILVLIGISTYITFVFRKVSQPVASWKFGVITLLTLAHDVIIPAGLFAVLGYYFGHYVDVNFIVALLVVLGFSVHDTIVVFDRVREKLLREGSKRPLGDLVNASINETLHRSINTTLTLIIVLVTLYFLGPVSLQSFTLTLLVGVTAGAYSSIFVASPLLVVAQNLQKKTK